MTDRVWKVSEDKPEITAEGDFYTKGIDYFPADLADYHWSKVDIHGENVEALECLAEVIVAALNEQEDILDG